MIEQNCNQKESVTFNDLPSMVTKILDEVCKTRLMVSDFSKKKNRSAKTGINP